MSKFGQELAAADEAPALPLWIDGHAYLMMADNFFNVQDQSGQVLRRVPLYGNEAVAIAANSGQLALDSWYALSYEKRKQCFRQFSELLTRYQDHFIQLIASESELGKEGAKEEVLQALRTAENARPGTHEPGYRKRIGAVISTPEAPFALALDCVMQALEAHWAVILKPCPKVPSALFACAELFSRAGFPGGLINCVQGDEAAIKALCQNGAISAIAFTGSYEESKPIGDMARETLTSFAGGIPGDFLQDNWRRTVGLSI